MLDYTTFTLLTDGEVKPHPEYHCDVPDGEPFLIGKVNEPCKLGNRCAVKAAGAKYHHNCADETLGPNFVCECSKCRPQYSFYYKSGNRGVICPWCVEHCDKR